MLNRRFHAYCVGTPRSGTLSVAEMLRKFFRAEHEPGSYQHADFLLSTPPNSLDARRIHTYFRERDLRLMLEMESAHYLYSHCGYLSQQFPQSKFILTLRSPVSWLRSEIQHGLQIGSESYWAQLRKLRYFSPIVEPSKEERTLCKIPGIFPLANYLRYWCEHNLTVISTVPKHQLLVLPTMHLSTSRKAIADFLEIPDWKIDLQHSHSNKTSRDPMSIATMINADHVESLAIEICGSTLRQHFPNLPLGSW